jgi:hypothetical protein
LIPSLHRIFKRFPFRKEVPTIRRKADMIGGAGRQMQSHGANGTPPDSRRSPCFVRESPKKGAARPCAAAEPVPSTPP